METTQETKRRRKQKPELSIDRLPPHSLESEQGVLGCLLTTADLIKDCESLRADSFYDLRHQEIFRACRELYAEKKSFDVITLQQRLRDKQLLEQVGGITYLATLPDVVISTTMLDQYVDTIAEKHRLREIISSCTEVVGQVYDYQGDIADLLYSVGGQLRDVFEPKQKNVGKAFTWSELTGFTTSNDPNNVIGMHNGRTTRYLCRGQSAWLIGPSGVGKSALLFQFGAAFAVGRPMFGVTPMRSLRVLIVQAENDQGDLAEMAKGIEAGLNLTDFEEIEMLEKNIRVRSVKGKIGQAFCLWLRREIEDFRADLVLVDPLLSFAGIDVSRQDQVSQFCRMWMDPVLEDTGAVLISAHHTGKPPGQQKNQTPQTLTDMAYAGIGSSELVNWARAVMLLQTAGEGTFRLQLAKRGKRACATHLNGEPTLTLWLKHAQSSIFWEQTEPPEEVDNRTKDSEPKLTKPQQIATCNLGTFLSACPIDGEGLREIVRRLKNWLGSKDSPQKSLASVADGSIRKAIGLMLDSEKLTLSDGRYLKGPNA